MYSRRKELCLTWTAAAPCESQPQRNIQADAKSFSATKQQYIHFTNSLVNIELFNFHMNRIGALQGEEGENCFSVAYMPASAITTRIMQTYLNLE